MKKENPVVHQDDHKKKKKKKLGHMNDWRWVPLIYSELLIINCTINYRCDGGIFPVSGSCSTMSHRASLSIHEIWINPGIRIWKKKSTYLNELYDKMPLVISTSQKKQRAETLHPSLEFGNVKPRLKSGIFICISWLNGSFLEVMIGVFWKRKSRHI